MDHYFTCSCEFDNAGRDGGFARGSAPVAAKRVRWRWCDHISADHQRQRQQLSIDRDAETKRQKRGFK
jgi:hypothetical protein